MNGGRAEAGPSHVRAVLVVGVAGRSYGVPIDAVDEVVRMAALDDHAAEGARLGTIDIRGTLIDVVDLAALLGGPAAEPQLVSRIVVVPPLGLLVDTVADVGEVALEPAEEPYAAGRAGDVVVLDLDALRRAVPDRRVSRGS